MIRQLVVIITLVMAAAANGVDAPRWPISEGTALPAPIVGIAQLKAQPRPDANMRWSEDGAPIALRARPDSAAPVLAHVAWRELLSEEFDYEVDGALVFERIPGWVAVARWLGDRGEIAWVEEREVDRWLPLSELLADGRYLTGAWQGKLFTQPGGPEVELADEVAREDRTPVIQVVSTVEREGVLWLELALMDAPSCAGLSPKPVQRVWIPAQGSDGRPAVWFHSRGC